MARDFIIIMRKQPFDYACQLLKSRNREVEAMKQDAIDNGATSTANHDNELLLLSKVMAAFADG